MIEHDDLGARLREAARDAAPPAYDAPTARRRAQARQRRGVAAGVLGVAAAAVGVSVLVASAQGGTSNTLPPATPPSVSPTSAPSVEPRPSTPAAGRTSAPPSEPAPSSPAPPVAEPDPAEPTGDDPADPPDDRAGATEPPVVEQPEQPSRSQPEQPAEPEQTEPPRRDPTTAPPARATTAPPRGGTVQLGGDDLGVTRVGAPRDEAVAALSAALRAPRTPSGFDCIGAEEELAFGDFRLAISGGRVSGWSSRSTTLRTPSGFRVGTSVAQMRARLGDRLVLSEANPDNPPGFRITRVQVFGDLSGSGDGATVTRLFNGACSGP